MRFNKKYFMVFVLIFFIELFIALYVRDNFIRPFIGDVLIIVLIYTFVRSFTSRFSKFLPIIIFVFSALVETAQYLKIVEILGLQKNIIISTILGTTFDIKDLLCYLLGMISLLIWEKISIEQKSKKSLR